MQRVGTAIDVLCYEKLTAQLTVVELKCNYRAPERPLEEWQRADERAAAQGGDHTLDSTSRSSRAREMFVQNQALSRCRPLV